MSAADDPKRSDGRDPLTVRMVESGEVVTLPYRKAVGLLSLTRATLVEESKPAKKAAKKS